jgi:hypothetical protein
MVAQYITVTESDPVRKKVDFFESRINVQPLPVLLDGWQPVFSSLCDCCGFCGVQPTFVTEDGPEAASQEPQVAVIPSSAKEHKLYQQGRERARKSIVSMSRDGMLPGLVEEPDDYDPSGHDHTSSMQH